MRHIRDRIIDVAEDDSLRFMSSRYDKGLLGYVEEGGLGKKMACYGYQAVKAVLGESRATPERMYAELRLMEADDEFENVMLLTRYRPRVLWEIAGECRFKRWESLDRAAIGIGSIGYDEVGIVYNKALCLDILKFNSTPMSGEGSYDYITDFFNRSVMSVNLADSTPYFLTQVK